MRLSDATKLGTGVGELWGQNLVNRWRAGDFRSQAGFDVFLDGANEYFRSEERRLIADGNSKAAAKAFGAAADDTFRRHIAELEQEQERRDGTLSSVVRLVSSSGITTVRRSLLPISLARVPSVNRK